ncbi:thymidylate kinase family protein [Cryptosporidium serpentis]
MKRGALIVFEGTDRSGKTLQSNKLVEKFKNEDINCILIGFPDRNTNIGHLLDLYLRNCENMRPEVSHLLFSANRWEYFEKIKTYLENGITVICDRYAFSGVAYSVGALKKDIEWCMIPEKGLVSPDIVLFLDANVQMQVDRNGFGDERYDTESTQNSVSAIYSQFKKYDYWKVIDASKDPNDVFENIYNLAKQALCKAENSHVKYLWS